ncbi:MAG: putative toxin-antitoxin system toxin component, PIN family [Burkholderiales bacterium PBB2]|nr:MAG: putative toxin-antitoxin system toxin component, PIN family [Burkholderiales bacterium PBB2]
MPDFPATDSAHAAPRIVIDTQVIMDWLVFRDPRAQALAQSVVGRQVQWIGEPAMLDELRHVLGRGVAAQFEPDLAWIESQFEQHCRMIASTSPPAVRLVCRDPDDQKFIDLALAQRAQWLLSRDRAVLALAKRARAQGLLILNPDRWTPPPAAGLAA